MLVIMNAIYEHPSLSMHVTPEQRDRAESWLKDAYADGRISEPEFDRRIGQILTAVTRKELNEAFYGLVQVPSSSRALFTSSSRSGRTISSILTIGVSSLLERGTLYPLSGT